MLARARHFGSARHFQAAHFGYFPSEAVATFPALGGGDDGEEGPVLRYTPRLQRYDVPILAHHHDDEEAILMAVMLAVAELELM